MVPLRSVSKKKSIRKRSRTMKKTISLLLALVLCLSLCACGGSTTEDDAMTVDDMLAVAEEADAIQINDDYDNQAKAKQLYCGKILKITGKVEEIHEDYILLGGAKKEYCPAVWVYLSTDDIVLLEEGQQITIVGQTEAELRKTTGLVAMLGLESDFLEMKEAYLVADTFEVSGRFLGTNYSYAPAINLDVEGEYSAVLVYFSDPMVTFDIEFNQQITVSGKIVFDDSDYDIFDATLVE